MISCRHCGERTYPRAELAIASLFGAFSLAVATLFTIWVWEWWDVAGAFVAAVLSAIIAGPFVVRELEVFNDARRARATKQSKSPWDGPTRPTPTRAGSDDTDDDE